MDATHATPAAPTRFAPAPHVVSAAQGGRTVILDPRGGEYYGLDEVGGRIWEMVGRGATLDEMADALAAEYDAPRTAIRADADALLQRLAALRLVVPR